MELVIWKDEYSVDHEIIDEQHRKLIKMINDLHEAMEAKRGSAVLDTIMKELSDYTFYHFSFEESYLEQIGYPDAEQHKRHHADLMKQVYDIFNRIYAEHLESVDDIYGFLKSWLVDHIMAADQKYRRFAATKSK